MDSFDKQLSAILSGAVVKIRSNSDRIAQKHAQKLARKIRAASPVDTKSWKRANFKGHYKDGWKSGKGYTNSVGSYEYTVYNSSKYQLPTLDEWTAGFTPRELLDAIGQAREIFISSLGESSGSGEGSSFCSEKLIASALLCGLRPDDLDDMPLPMVLDTIGEWCRIKGGSDDDARPAAQEDFDAL